MHDDDTQHLHREPDAVGKAVAWAILSLAALASAYATTRSAKGLVLMVPLLGIALFFVYLGAWGVFATLRVERHFNVVAAIAGLVLGTLPLALIFSGGPAGTEQPAVRPSTTATRIAPTTTTTTTTSTIVATTTTTVAATTSTTAPPTTAGGTTGVVPHLRWIGVQPASCLDVPSDEPGGRVQVSPCEDTAAMEWQLTSAGQIKGRGGNNCISLTGPYEPNGYPVTMVPCDATDEGQGWSRDGQRIRNQKGGCLDVDRAGDKHVQIWECDESVDQLWLSD